MPDGETLDPGTLPIVTIVVLQEFRRLFGMIETVYGSALRQTSPTRWARVEECFMTIVRDLKVIQKSSPTVGGKKNQRLI